VAPVDGDGDALALRELFEIHHGPIVRAGSAIARGANASTIVNGFLLVRASG